MRWSTEIILFVDGDNEVPKNASEALALTDYIILHASTTQEALSLLSYLNYVVDLVVIDVDMPDDMGLGFLERLSTLGYRKASKIIAQTSRQDESFLGWVSCLGVDAILKKPTSAEQLVGTVHSMLA
jgi:DNA-binding response OmpR family regulator